MRIGASDLLMESVSSMNMSCVLIDVALFLIDNNNVTVEFVFLHPHKHVWNMRQNVLFCVQARYTAGALQKPLTEIQICRLSSNYPDPLVPHEITEASCLRKIFLSQMTFVAITRSQGLYWINWRVTVQNDCTCLLCDCLTHHPLVLLDCLATCGLQLNIGSQNKSANHHQLICLSVSPASPLNTSN